ncbi:ribosome maturation factor RimP [Streptomyces sp. NPDC048606]|uniref:ribosome maturation factor RimP n=1 Tax=Streptomyces sp. NPDC048606 TaxID=3154726 RepID=UPI003418CB1B
MSTTQSDRLRGLLEPLVTAKGLDLEDIELSKAGRRRMLRIIVDSDEGLDLDLCAELSREISDKLDETDVMGEDEYQLEVSSPGADRPLTEHRHYVRATGRLVKFQLSVEGDKGDKGEELIARILGVDDEGMDLEVPGVKGRKATARRVAFTDIARARVEIEFNRKDKSGMQKEEEA